jgi:hypothetical protein
MANSIYVRATATHQFSLLDFNSMCLMPILQLCSSIRVDVLVSISLLRGISFRWDRDGSIGLASTTSAWQTRYQA